MEQSRNNARPQTLFFTASPTLHCSLDSKTFISCPVPFDQGLAKNAVLHFAFCTLHSALRPSENQPQFRIMRKINAPNETRYKAPSVRGRLTPPMAQTLDLSRHEIDNEFAVRNAPPAP